MGFLEKIFGQPEKNYTLEESIEAIKNELNKIESTNNDEMFKISNQIYPALRDLQHLIEEFHKKDVPGHAKSSANVKDRFCSMAVRQLLLIKPPDKANTETFLKAASNIIETLGGLTHRQIMHINFFFKEDFRPIAKKINEINSMLSMKDNSTDHKKAVSYYNRINILEENKKKLLEEKRGLEENMKELEKIHEETFLHTFEKPDRSALYTAENRLKIIRQEIDSVLSVQKLLKKYVHRTNTKDVIIEAYIESPSSAILLDRDLTVLEVIKNALKMLEERKIDLDTPKKKLDIIFEKADYLREKRRELEEAAKAVEFEKERFEKISRDIVEKEINRKRQIENMEAEINKCKKAIESCSSELRAINEELPRLQADLRLLASRILNTNVT